MKTLVLVHGMFGDHHVWVGVKPMLEDLGFIVITPDLPGHGTDDTPHEEITLDTYVDSIAGLITQEPDRVILIGHSMAGMVISGVAEKIPDSLEAIVYVAAYLPQDGQTLMELAGGDKDTSIAKVMEFLKEKVGLNFTHAPTVEAIVENAPPEVQRAIVSSQHIEPIGAFLQPIKLTQLRFGRVKKFYIEALNDRAISNPMQRKMIDANGMVEQVFTLPNDHLSFLLLPKDLVGFISEIAGGPSVEVITETVDGGLASILTAE